MVQGYRNKQNCIQRYYLSNYAINVKIFFFKKSNPETVYPPSHYPPTFAPLNEISACLFFRMKHQDLAVANHHTDAHQSGGQ